MTIPRFYLPPEAWLAPTPHLEGTDTHHAVHVLRRNIGDPITVFNGQGTEATATIAGFQKNKTLQALVTIGTQTQTRQPRARITLAQAVPKGKNMDLIIQKAVELGASRIIPILSERTLLRCSNEQDALQKQDRWQQIAIEACKQCGQNWLPCIEKPCSFQHFFSLLSSELLLLASLENQRRSLKEVLVASPSPNGVTIMIGPEGDFTPAESAMAKEHGFQPIHLGPIILRTETAALYSLSVLAYEFCS